MPALRLLESAGLPADLPHLWHGQEMARAEAGAVSTGHQALDSELPGGGWPLGLVEVVQERPEQHVWQLTAPALAQVLQKHVGPVVLVSAPFEPFIPAVQAQGIAGDRLLWIRAAKPAQRLWATEQALRCGEVSAVLAWLPQARGAELRRLQIAASQHQHLLFVFRGLRSIQDASPARVRLQLSGQNAMEVRVLKRRGPPLDRTLHLPACPPRMTALLEARGKRASPSGIRPQPQSAQVVPLRRSDVLDRTAALG